MAEKGSSTFEEAESITKVAVWVFAGVSYTLQRDEGRGKKEKSKTELNAELHAKCVASV